MDEVLTAILVAWVVMMLWFGWLLLKGWWQNRVGATTCYCGKFSLDDSDPLVTPITIHEKGRCQPRRESLR